MTSLFITLREAIQCALILLLLTGVYKEHKKALIISAILVIIAGILTTSINYPLSGPLERTYTDLMYYSFLMILILSLMPGRGTVVFPAICVALALFFPSAQLASVIMEEAYLKGGLAYIYSFAGFFAGVFIFKVGLRYLPGLDLRRFFRTDGIMVVIAVICFLFGGMNEFDGSSVITSLQQGSHKLLSSFFVSVKEVMLILNEGTISTGLENALNYLSSERVAMAFTAFILFMPPVFVFIKLLLSPEPSTENIDIKAEKRKIISVYIDELIKKGTPLIIALIIIIVLMHAANLAVNPRHDPEPIPVVAEEEIIIPLKDKYGDISDGRIRKFSFRQEGRVYRLLVIMRPDGNVVSALDACEICPPSGYVQRGEHVICKYCSTPIPLQSLGEPGGCNPIPVMSRLEGGSLIVLKDDIVRTHNRWIGADKGQGRIH
jgi:uncharacterized membrane protein